MKLNRKIVCLLCTALLFLLLACSGGGQYVYVDADGNAYWEPIEGAVEYEAELRHEESGEESTFRPDANTTTAEVPAGCTIRVRAVFEDESTGEWMTMKLVDGAEGGIKERVDENYNIYWEDLKSYEILSNIDWNSVETQADGSVTFEAKGPDGNKIHFVGREIELEKGKMILHPNAGVYALESIGRIAAVDLKVKDSGDPNNWCWSGGGYTFTSATEVASEKQLYYVPHLSVLSSENEVTLRCVEFQPNFIAFGAENENMDEVTISEATIYYDETTYNTGLTLAAISLDNYGTYLAGEHYDKDRERFNVEEGIYDFALVLFPEVSDANEPLDVSVLEDDVIHQFATIYDVDESLYTIGALRDASGNELDKDTDALTQGCTLDVTLGDYTMAVALPVEERYAGAQTLHELMPYHNAEAQGEKLSLVIPISWQDQPENATDETLSTIYAKLGRVMDVNGTVTDYSGNLTNQFSLSGYFDAASYGKFGITSYVTDWYAAPYDYAEMQDRSVADDEQFRIELYEWLMRTYPDMDWSRFDTNGDGILDSVILVNAGTNTGDEFQMQGYGYALFINQGYTGEKAGTPDKPVIKDYVSINTEFLADNALIHEVSHSFGIIDYYDVTYSGVDAVGGYDMQSNGVGDWNAFSKYAAGWIDPQIVSGLESGEFVEFTIGGFAETGDAIVIPAAGTDHDGPFGEYILLDLFTDGGVNRYDAAQYGLSGAAGVRISHVDANMEKRILIGEDGVEYPIGTTHIANDYDEKGKYQLEVIQAGGVNTFTDPSRERKQLAAEDLFRAGDVFDAENYAQFLIDGRMDDGNTFGYTVEIVSIQQNTAVIRITRK